MDDKKLEKLKQIIENFNKKPRQSIKLNPPIALEQVQKIEKRYNISFPKDYVEFITEIGDGGIIHCKRESEYDDIIVHSLGKKNKTKSYFSDMEKPFPLVKSWLPEYGDIVEGDENLDPDKDANILEKHRIEQWDRIVNDGVMHLLESTSSNCNFLLIITGTCKGEVWLITEIGVNRYIECSFTKWLQLHLTNKLHDFEIKSGKKENPRNPDPKIDCIEFMNKHKFIMNPPIELSKVLEFEQKHKITLPEEYVTFITEIGDGSKRAPFNIDRINELWENDCLSNMDKPFLLQNEVDYKRIFKDENNNYKFFSESNSMWDFLFEKPILEACQKKNPWLLPQFQLLQGCLPIMNAKVKENATPAAIKQYILVLNGDYKGRIFSVTGKKIIMSIDVPVHTFTFLEAVLNGDI